MQCLHLKKACPQPYCRALPPQNANRSWTAQSRMLAPLWPQPTRPGSAPRCCTEDVLTLHRCALMCARLRATLQRLPCQCMLVRMNCMAQLALQCLCPQDVYAMGIILWELMTLELPWAGQTNPFTVGGHSSRRREAQQCQQPLSGSSVV